MKIRRTLDIPNAEVKFHDNRDFSLDNGFGRLR
jgi:hypothetical protein